MGILLGCWRQSIVIDIQQQYLNGALTNKTAGKRKVQMGIWNCDTRVDNHSAAQDEFASTEQEVDVLFSLLSSISFDTLLFSSVLVKSVTSCTDEWSGLRSLTLAARLLLRVKILVDNTNVIYCRVMSTYEEY